MLRFFRRAAYEIGGLRFSLEDIEHGILRANRGFLLHPGPQFGKDDPRRKFVFDKLDARIHFALNCASRSCPPIAYYSPEIIEQQLNLAASNFIQENVVLDRSGVMLKLSRIFKWYQRDFGGKTGVLAMIQDHLPEKDIRRILIKNFGDVVLVEYAKYDWHLNVLE